MSLLVLLACTPPSDRVATPAGSPPATTSGSASAPTGGTAAPPGAALPDHVVVVIFDTARWDRLGAMGGPCSATPTLDALAERGVLLERVVPPRGLTFSSVTTLLTGSEPRTHGVWAAGNAMMEDVPRWTDQANRPVGVFAVNACNTWTEAGGLDTLTCYDDVPEGQDRGLLYDAQAVADALDWIDGREGPWVAVVHLMAPHSPHGKVDETWKQVASACPGVEPVTLDVDTVAAWTLGDEEVPPEVQEALLLQQDSAQAYDDALVAQLLAELQARGFEDDGLLLVGADHGEDLLTHAEDLYMGHEFAPWPSVLHTSWVAYAPAFLPPQRVENTVCMSDLGATLFSLTGPPWPGGEGRDIWDQLRSGRPPEPRTCFAEITDDVGLVADDDYMLLLSPTKVVFEVPWMGLPVALRMPAVALWDLQADPLGLVDVSEERQFAVDELASELCAFVLDGPYQDREVNGSDIRTMCEETAARSRSQGP